MSSGLDNETPSSLNGQAPPESLVDVSLELETSPELEAVSNLYDALRAARLRPDDSETKRAVAVAWGDVYRHMPTLIGITLDQPAEPPSDERAVQRVGLEVMDIDRSIRPSAGRLLALASVTGHPDSRPIGNQEVAAFDRVSQLATMIGEQVGHHMRHRLRP